jgi:hypothetical protein
MLHIIFNFWSYSCRTSTLIYTENYKVLIFFFNQHKFIKKPNLCTRRTEIGEVQTKDAVYRRNTWESNTKQRNPCDQHPRFLSINQYSKARPVNQLTTVQPIICIYNGLHEQVGICDCHTKYYTPLIKLKGLWKCYLNIVVGGKYNSLILETVPLISPTNLDEVNILRNQNFHVKISYS